MTVAREHFPPTPRTVVLDAIEQGRALEIARDLMELYAEPLQIYFASTSFRGLGEPKDIVAGFLSNRLSDPGWFADWKTRHEVDRIPLRRWLLNSLNFYLHEEYRRLARERRDGDPVGGRRIGASPAETAERAFDRQVARAIVGRALERTREVCAAAGQDRHIEVFMRHFIGRIPYDRLAAEFGLGESQCAGMSRTVAMKFRREIAAILVQEGADPCALDLEITNLIEACAP